MAAVIASPIYPVKSTYGYGNGRGSYVVRSQVDCIRGEACGALPSLPAFRGRGAFRTESREPIIHKGKREANPVKTAYSYSNGGGSQGWGSYLKIVI